jgi:hypothetical protein
MKNSGMKTSTKVAIGVAVAATAALSAFVAGVVHEFKEIRKLTTDADDALPEEILAEDEESAVEIIDG